MDALAAELEEAGGTAAPRERSARLRELLEDELAHSARELGRSRSGRQRPVTVAFAASSLPAPGGDAGAGVPVPPNAAAGERAPAGRPLARHAAEAAALVAVVPVAPELRADPAAAPERGFLAAAAAIGALVEVAAPAPPAGPGDLLLLAGALGGHLALALPARPAADDAELCAVAFDEHAAGIDRLRSRALALPAHALAGASGWRAPPAPALRVAEAVARLGGRPADAASVADHEDAALALLGGDGGGPARPHDDPEPARRIARRILQRLHGMGKWGNYHTDERHLSRGFEGNERALADAVGQALLDAGLLASKPSVGQRHVFLNPRRAADVHRLIERGELPPGLRLPR